MKKVAPLAFIVVAVLAGCMANQKHHIRDQPATGSKIPRKAVTGPIPFNKNYEELTDSEKKAFTLVYENFPPQDEPPFPIGGLEVISKPIHKAQEKRLARGSLSIIAVVDEQGVVRKAEVYESPDKYISKVATAVLFSTKFKPGKCSGTPCVMEFPFFFNFLVK
ncbi:hypothetical protein FKG94_03740 [Exilibacterium tricleocarpae]|uniref:TonB C-terminal domain-containing protein n=1 Tax=Exilibacterium tricleocarpae TaxID=2591008 RepID=A0A545U5A5_9GAMM|nr:hypothetical protein [Exilibacterium tricleocarpae]TQV84644.1 hypothetical protein FKG94_03740 [Exilibacterium tricleocarpae]